jgi:hypothetical protein
MAEIKAQTTRGKMLGEKPPEVWTVYAPDGTPHKCAPCDAREILAAGLGYTSEPSAAAPLTGETIIDAAYAEVSKHEQQSEQQSMLGDSVTGAEAAGAAGAKPDDSGSANAAGQTGPGARNKARK